MESLDCCITLAGFVEVVLWMCISHSTSLSLSLSHTHTHSHTMSTINFYGHTKPFGYFSNFYEAKVTIDGKEWPTTEHYFQALKFTDKDYQEEIRLAKSERSPLLVCEHGCWVGFSPFSLPCGLTTCSLCCCFCVVPPWLQHQRRQRRWGRHGQ